MGSLVAVRLYQKIKDSLRLEIEGVRFFTDSSAVLGMINKDSGTFLEFVGTRVSEIRTKWTQNGSGSLGSSTQQIWELGLP